MINAEEARRIMEIHCKQINSKVSLEVYFITANILEACRKGESIILLEELSKVSGEALRELGYLIITVSKGYEIRW